MGVCLFVVALSIGYGVSYARNLSWTRELVAGIVPVRENNFNYKFIYPLLYYKYGNARYLIEDGNLENQLNAYIQTQYQNHNADSIAVYYRNFLTNIWSSVNESVPFHPGSMMKVLVMMAYYRESQLDPSVLQKIFTYTSDVSDQASSLNYEQRSYLSVGQSYTTEELIEAMIENSDNGAAILLLNSVNHKILDDVFNDLGITNPDQTNNLTISAAQYGNFLRILYNSTYLSEINSEKALSIMSKSTFQSGISAGVPANVVTAQKYGEYLDTNSSNGQINAVELSNCGVVYASDRPYELCVMVKDSYDGKGQADEQRLASIIKDISSIVYNYSDKEK